VNALSHDVHILNFENSLHIIQNYVQTKTKSKICVRTRTEKENFLRYKFPLHLAVRLIPLQ